MSRFIGIRRERVFSPGRVQDDGAILALAADHLRWSGCTVEVCGAEDARWPEPAPDTAVFTMAQGPAALERLHRWEARGVRVVNSPQGIVNCQRHRTVAAFAREKVAFPETILVDTAVPSALPSWAMTGAWVKRGDVHATERDDVVAVEGPEAIRLALRRFHQRGIRNAVVQRHVAGQVLKFYAVRGRFFHCVPPSPGGEIPPAVLQGLAELGAHAAKLLNVEVYGGDCVCDVNGVLTLIDLNDWPSYAPCRAEAARAIAAHLLAQEPTSEP